jgi:hypothetical protein
MFGPKHSGLYASKLYIPVTVILIGLWVFNSRIVPRPLLYILIGVHLFRLVIDLRKAPIAAVLLGLLSIVFLAGVTRLFQKSGRLSLPMICRGRIAVVLLVPLLTIGLLMILVFHGLSLYESTFFDLSSGPGALLKGYSWRFHYEQFERYGGNRIIDYHAALSDPRWNPIFGAGLGTKFDLIEANRIHSLYVFILAHMGIAGLLLLFLMMVATFGAGIRAAIRSNTLDRFGNYIALTSAFVSYAAFFTFSVRGTDFEAMIIFSVLAGLITEHIALGRHRPNVAGMPE